MLQSIQKMYGEKLAASDGEVGHVKDFYFDDQSWAIRYMVADTGTWLPGRRVLISPYAFGSLHQAGKLLLVNLSRKQIEDSPSIDLHKPLSRQYEEEYYRYYGWPSYWEGDSLWGMSGFPIGSPPPNAGANKPVTLAPPQLERNDAHLRSTQAVNGYQLHSINGMIGHVCDFMMDTQSWAIEQLVIKTGHRFSGKEVRLLASTVNRISYDDSTIYVDLTKEALEQESAQHLASVGAAV